MRPKAFAHRRGQPPRSGKSLRSSDRGGVRERQSRAPAARRRSGRLFTTGGPMNEAVNPEDAACTLCTSSSARAWRRSPATTCRSTIRPGSSPSTCTPASSPGCSTFRIWARRCIEGADHAAVAAFLETLCPADLLSLAPGRQRYTPIAQRRRRDRRRPDGRPPARRGRRVETRRQRLAKSRRLRAHSPRACPPGVRLTPLPEAALIALQGPLAAATLARLAPGEGLETMAFMSARPARIAGFETFVSRSGYTGEDGYEISLAVDAGGKLRSHSAGRARRRADRSRRARFAAARGRPLPLRA